MTERNFRDDLNLVIHMADALIKLGDDMYKQVDDDGDLDDSLRKDAESGREGAVAAIENVKSVLSEFKPPPSRDTRHIGLDMDPNKTPILKDWDEE